MTLRKEGYWDSHYELELRNFDDSGDEGDVWFGKNLSLRISNWIIDWIHMDPNLIRILDVGCGNAFMLISILCKYRQKLKILNSPEESQLQLELRGIDYAENSIILSKKILESKGLKDQIHLSQCDFLDLEQVQRVCSNYKYDFIIDKGTYDAICLLASEDNIEDTRCSYLKSIYSLTKDGTVFILTSCNYTEEELMSLFTHSAKKGFNNRVIDKIETPKHSFGGQQGSSVCCIIIQFSSVPISPS